MGRIQFATACAALVFLASPLADAAPCDGIPAAGCCDGATLKFCRSDGTLATVNCEGLSPSDGYCRWDFGHEDETNGHYACTAESWATMADPSGAVPRACPAPAGACIPDCTGKECGDDGCGGTCGTCPNGTCNQFTCQDTGTFCGNASLPPYSGCCDGPVYKYCTDSGLRGYSCDASGLDRRCGVSNGRGGCYLPSAASALPDCPGGCERACAGKTCGDDGCGGSCGTCPAGEACRAGVCATPSCTPACGRGQVCTFDGCEWQECITPRTTTGPSVNPALSKSGAIAVWGPGLWYSMAAGGARNPVDNFPALSQGVKAIAVGGTHVVAIDNNGDAHEWGPNSVFGCGGPWVSRPAGMGAVSAVSSWRCGFIGLHGTGKVAVWGDADYFAQIQAQYADAITDAVAVAAGGDFLVLRRDGTVSMFSAPGSPADVHTLYTRYKHTPEGEALWDAANGRFVSYVRALPGIRNATAISAYGGHYLVVNGDGNIVEWGSAWDYRARPPTELANNVKQIVAGSGYSLALLRSGALRLWTDDPTNPRQQGLVDNVPNRRDFVALAPGTDPGALAADGSVVMWDRNGPIAAPADLGFVSKLAIGSQSGSGYVAVGVTNCTQKCTPSCNANTCQADGCGGICPNCGGCDPDIASCACVPQCDGKQCGPDRCGGTCGTCEEGAVCTSTGLCGCVPDCDGKECGPNGCGGTCGSCDAPETCSASGTCACIPQCDGKQCGPDGCGGTCGTCAGGTACNAAGTCDCVPSCDGRECGDDGCGGSCGYCGAYKRCTAAGTCECAPNCPSWRICGPDGCGGTCGACPAGETCNDDGSACGCVASCVDKECGGDGCGGLCPGQGCGRDEECIDYQCLCKPKCTEWPEGISGCGSDGCGGTCGTCGPGTACNRNLGPGGSLTDEGICECAPNCTGKQCGPDGCGGSCGVDRNNATSLSGCERAYGLAYQCNAVGQCQCIPDCTGRQCGDDGCGGSCGKCRSDQQCSDDLPPTDPLNGAGRCVCKPNCDGRQCGPDGCGGTCGSCADGLFCDNQAGQCLEDPCAELPAANCCAGTKLVTCDEEEHKVVVLQCGANRWGCGWLGSTNEYECGGGGQTDPSGANPIACPADLCVPDCLHKQCGPDGCGGSCGDGCAPGTVCDNGFCGIPCQPDCAGKVCGNDGCGGSCGGCAGGQACAGGQCCTPQCDGKSCGPDGCGGTCGTCEEGETCGATGQCEPSPCDGFTRTNGCCLPDNSRVWCDTATNRLKKEWCPSGGDFKCGWSRTESAFACVPKSQGSVTDPSQQNPYLCPRDTCVPNCGEGPFAKRCGDDGCGGTCGTCPDGQACSGSGGCYVPPPPCDCTNRCAADNCTGTCPPCEDGLACMLSHQYESVPFGNSGYLHSVDVYGTCVEPCQGKAPVVGCCAKPGSVTGSIARDVVYRADGSTARNAVFTCPGPDTASRLDIVEERCDEGVQCGWSSEAGQFTCGGTDPVPDGVDLFCPEQCSCTGKSCGDDGCGGSCGTCPRAGGDPNATFCGINYMCVDCAPICTGVRQLGGGRFERYAKQCGSDQCEGSCGTCLRGDMTCGDDGLCKLPASCGSITTAGTCEGDTARYCTAYGVEEVDCTLTGQRCRDGRCVTGAPQASAHTCAPADCGSTNAAWACQCDAGCAERNDCCANYDTACGMDTSVGSCGDGTCQSGAGEDCLTCASDCRACATIAATASAVVAPYAKSLHNVGFAGQSASYDVVPIDDVRPGGPPWPREGLVAYLPQPRVNAGDPRTLVINDAASGSGAVSMIAQGRQGAAFSFDSSSSAGRNETLCGTRVCGPDGAGGSCGTCPTGTECDAFWGSCYDPASCAGNSCVVRSLSGFPEDMKCGTDGCGRPCGDEGGVCENDGACRFGDGFCDRPVSTWSWDPCENRECGPTRWSGVSCGTCADGTMCNGDGRCVTGVAANAVVRIVPDDIVPRDGSPAEHTQGGSTLAFWTRVPSGSLANVNPLASVRSSTQQAEVCTWTRPSETTASVSCPGGQRIVAIDAYWGSADRVPGQDGTCDGFRRIRKTHACTSTVVKADAAACVGQTSCHLDYSLDPDPCASEGAGSTLALRAVCDAPSEATSTLYVGNATEGNHLRFSLPSAPDLVSRSSIVANTWTHVALVQERRARGLGTVTLWINGELQATARGVVFPDAYEWDLGAGYFPGFPNIPNAINTDAKITDASGTPIGSRKPWNVAGAGDVDDVFLYDRALSRVEIGALFEKPDAGALRVWPAIGPARALAETSWAGLNASTVPVEAKALLDPARSTAAAPVRFAADEPALDLPGSTTFVAGDPAPDLASLSTFTLAGWVRPTTLFAGTKLLELTEGTSSQLVIATASACSGSAATASLLGSALTATTTCEHGLAAGEWAFVAYVQDGTKQSVYVDGVLTASGTAPRTIFTGTDGATRALRGGDGVDLAWASVYRTAYTPDLLEALRSQGPAVWIEGAIKLDLAAFANNASGTATDRAVLWSGTSGLSTAGSGATVTVPARGRFRPLNGGGERAFSWSGQVGLPSTIGTAALTLPLFTLDQPGSRLAEASLSCARADADGRVACRVLVSGVGADGRYHRWSSDNRIALSSALSAGATARVAISFNRAPTAALYLQKSDGGAVPLSVEASVGLTIGEVGTPGAAPTSSATAHQFVLPAPTPGSVGTWSDVRLYARVLSQLELIALAARGCDAQNCGSQYRVCVTPRDLPGAGTASLDLSVCGSCSSGNVDQGGSCLPKQRFEEVCSSDFECESGICGPDLTCLEPTATVTCRNECANQFRDCVQVTGGTGYTCSASCHDASTVRASGQRCEWYPTQEPGDACTSDYDCVSKACLPTTRPRYSVQDGFMTNGNHCGFPDQNECCMAIQHRPSEDRSHTVYSYSGDPTNCARVEDSTRPVSVCAGFDNLSCDRHNRVSVPTTADVPGIGSMSVFSCGGCKEGYREQWTMLSPQACTTMWKNYYELGDYKNENYQGKKGIYAEPSLATLRRLLLADTDPTSRMTPRKYAELDEAGAGPIVVNWEKLHWSDKEKYRPNWYTRGGFEKFHLADCNKATFDDERDRGYDRFPSVFFNSALNYPVCVARRWPNGATCPQPGVTLSRAQAGQNCLSGFCAHDTGVCEDGDVAFEQTQGAARNDANQGGTSDNDIGGIGLVQNNYSYARVSAATGANVTDKRTYGIGVGSSHTVNVFGLLQYDALDVNVALATRKEARKGTYDQSVEVFGLDVPIPPPDRPEAVARVTRPLAGCSEAVWSDGEWTGSSCTVRKDDDGQAIVADIEPVEIAIPLPIGECQEWGKGSAAVATSGVKQKGKLCFKETTVVGFVPITVKAEVTIKALVRFGAIVDPTDVSPAFEVAPGLGIGLDVRGGVGIQEFVTVYAGVRADITIVELTFPITWSLKADELSDSNQRRIADLFAVKFKRDVSLELRFLKMALGIFLEMGIGPFTHEWNWDLLGFEGIRLRWTLNSDTLQSTKVDFQWQP